MNISFLLKKKKKVEGRRIRNYKGHSMACSTKYRNTPIEKGYISCMSPHMVKYDFRLL